MEITYDLQISFGQGVNRSSNSHDGYFHIFAARVYYLEKGFHSKIYRIDLKRQVRGEVWVKL